MSTIGQLVALNLLPSDNIFVTLYLKSWMACYSIIKNRDYRVCLDLKALKAKVKGVFNRIYRCYSNLLCQGNDDNITCPPNDQAFDWCHYCDADWERVIVLIHQSRRTEKCWKLLSPTLRYLAKDWDLFMFREVYGRVQFSICWYVSFFVNCL